uniref:Protein kinase domain-containing protein n=1 Tax=Timema poppense TaxID=170557 RepID=A0A7R9D462_TIMPO|nr:unnamed protein product [Timema poppensis]
MEFNKPKSLNFARDLAKNFDEFQEEVLEYFEATETETKSSGMQIARIKNLLGQDAVRLYKTLTTIKPEEETVNGIYSVLKSHCIPKKNETILVFNFFNRKQCLDEPFENFYAELRALATPCEFGDQEDKLQRVQIILGVNSQSLKQHLLREDTTLHKVVEYCKSVELADKNLKTIEDGEGSSQSDIFKVSRKTTTPQTSQVQNRCHLQKTGQSRSWNNLQQTEPLRPNPKENPDYLGGKIKEGGQCYLNKGMSLLSISDVLLKTNHHFGEIMGCISQAYLELCGARLLVKLLIYSIPLVSSHCNIDLIYCIPSPSPPKAFSNILNKPQLNLLSYQIYRGFSTVSLVEDAHTHKYYAVKKIICHGKEDQNIALKEVEFYNLLKHPNIIECIDSTLTGQPDPQFNFTSEVLVILPYYQLFITILLRHFPELWTYTNVHCFHNADIYAEVSQETLVRSAILSVYVSNIPNRTNISFTLIEQHSSCNKVLERTAVWKIPHQTQPLALEDIADPLTN